MAAGPLVAVLLVCSTTLVVGSALNGESIADAAFGNLTEPDGAIDSVIFAFELLLGLGKVLIAILSADFGWPAPIRFIVAAVCDSVIVVSIVGLFK